MVSGYKYRKMDEGMIEVQEQRDGGYRHCKRSERLAGWRS